MIPSYDGKISIVYYKDKLKAERDLEIMTMKFDLANQLLLRIKQKEEKFVKQNEFLKLINDNITFTNKKMMDEIIILKNQNKKLDDKFENLNKIMVKDNNSTKKEIKKSIENQIQLSNKSIIDQNNVLNENIKLVENEIQKLSKNIDQLKKEINSNIEEKEEDNGPKETATPLTLNSKETNTIVKEEEEDDGPKFQDGTVDIWQALMKGSLAGVKYWYALDPSSISRKDKKYPNRTPLHYASLRGHLGIVNFMLFKGVDVDGWDSTNCTPLMDASLNRHLSVVKSLLDNGAEINRQSRNQTTALHYAVSGNKLSVVKLLIERGANKNIKDIHNETPLDSARKWGGVGPSIINYMSSLN